MKLCVKLEDNSLTELVITDVHKRMTEHFLSIIKCENPAVAVCLHNSVANKFKLLLQSSFEWRAAGLVLVMWCLSSKYRKIRDFIWCVSTKTSPWNCTWRLECLPRIYIKYVNFLKILNVLLKVHPSGNKNAQIFTAIWFCVIVSGSVMSPSLCFYLCYTCCSGLDNMTF